MARLKEITRYLRKGRTYLRLSFTTGKKIEECSFKHSSHKRITAKIKKWTDKWKDDLITSELVGGATNKPRAGIDQDLLESADEFCA